MSVADFTRYEMRVADSLTELCETLATEHSRAGGVSLLAGGTDLMVQIAQAERAAGPLPLVIDISRLRELRGVDWDGSR